MIGTSGLDSLRFAATGSSDSLGGSLDKVALVAVAAAPEPGALALLLAALAGLGLAGRRSKR